MNFNQLLNHSFSSLSLSLFFRSFVTLDSDPNTLLEFVNGKLSKRYLSLSLSLVYDYAPRPLIKKEEQNQSINHHSPFRHPLPYPVKGNSHVIYNNVFFYHQLNTRSLVRYDLENKTSAALDIDDVAYGRSSR